MDDFRPARISVFEDPADEKASRGSQSYSALSRYFTDREPSWYESITREFAGLGRVLDLGTGPGLALDALRAHGVREPIGVERLSGFLRDAEDAGRRVILHDLTLPMPFLRSGSFDGVFSHFALDYISPIGVEQVLREARRLLEPGGLMALHLSTAGLALGDPARTSPYDEPALTRLLRSAGFEDFEIAVPEEDREVVIVHARGPGPETDGIDGGAGEDAALEYEAGGEIQVAAGARLSQPPGDVSPIAIEVSDGERSIGYRPRLGPASADPGEAFVDICVCARLVAVGPDRFELQAWIWQGARIAAADTIGIRFRPELLRVQLAGVLEHRDLWRPEPPMVEVPGEAYTTIDNASPDRRPGEAWRARGRQVIVERHGDDTDLLRAAAQSKDHFLVHRPDPAALPDVEALDRDWKDERLDGIALELEHALRPESLPLLLWADFRGALVYVETGSWEELGRTAAELPATPASPLLIVDPALSGRAEAQAEVEVPSELVEAALGDLPGLHLVLGASTAAHASALGERHPTRLLLGESAVSGGQELDERLVRDATENLRYLTERTQLMRLRGTSVELPGHLVQMCG